MYFIGDIHGKFNLYRKILNLISKNETILQLGDMGLGFDPELDKTFPIMCNSYFIRGNHDNPGICQKTLGYLGDYGYFEQYNLYYISGAYSIDRDFRTIGKNFWENEELSYNELESAIKECVKLKPSIIISHACPDSIQEYFICGQKIRSKTGLALQEIFEQYQPKYWIFGHYHTSRQIKIEQTKFICLNELEIFQL